MLFNYPIYTYLNREHTSLNGRRVTSRDIGKYDNLRPDRTIATIVCKVHHEIR